MVIGSRAFGRVLVAMRATTLGLFAVVLGGCTGGRLNIGPDDSGSVGGAPSLVGTDLGGDATSLGGATSLGDANLGGGTSAAGAHLTGGDSTVAGSPGSAAGNSSTGCTGALEQAVPIGNTRLCVTQTVAIAGPGATTYRIDATEVTRGQYEAWVATNPALPASTDARCGWKGAPTAKGYAASSSCLNQAGVCQTGCAQHPQVCVDWCDAYAYCAAVGKRLCGAIGGGSIAISDFANATKSQWYRACSSGGVNSFPYGNTYDGKRCNGYDYWGAAAVRTTVPVGTLAGCQSTVPGYGGVYDLSGNMREWVDSCNSSVVGATCALRGGAFNDSGGLGSYLDCAAGDGAPPDMAVNAGFRCCADDT